MTTERTDKDLETNVPKKEDEAKRRGGRLSLRPAGAAGRTVDAGSVRQSFSHGRSKEVRVEVRRPKRTPAAKAPRAAAKPGVNRGLTNTEQERRQQVLVEQRRRQEALEKARQEAETIRIRSAAEEAARQAAEQERQKEEDRLRQEAQAAQKEAPQPAARKNTQPEPQDLSPLAGSMGGIQLAEPLERLRPLAERAIMGKLPPKPEASTSERSASAPKTLRLSTPDSAGSDDARGGSKRGAGARRPTLRGKGGTGDRRSKRIDVQAALNGEDGKTRSLASVRRQRDRERHQMELERLRADQVKVVREVVVPETLTVAELAGRMAVRQSDVTKALMKMGVMAAGSQSIDGDTAELIVEEFGHRVKRVSESDVELGLDSADDAPESLKPRAPVVTVMGHVDHGKTTLLDALRKANVAGAESGGITQHIAAYQVDVPNKGKVTFIDTPGHAAFSLMRARGTAVTDIVILVVAADDGVMPQTIEAIKHAQESKVPMIVAINKMDKPGVDPTKVRHELLNHEIVVESLGGDVQEVEISAKTGMGLDNLLEAIMLQAEVLEPKANPDRSAIGAVIESRLDRGRGTVTTVLVQKGTLRKGEIVVAGSEWGKVRVLLDDKGENIESAGPSVPVEVLGMGAPPEAGAVLVAVENENRAREIATFRQRVERDKQAAAQAAARGTLDQMLQRIQDGERKEVSLLIKSDVRGSAEALSALVQGAGNDEVGVRVLSSGVGQITESDVQLAHSSEAVIVAFNVRPTAQARRLATRDGVDIRYYSIIYQVAEDVEKLVKGKIAPKHREKFLGYAEIRQVFSITKVGKVAGCYVTEGQVKRGCGVRLLRDNVVIHQGDLSQLKRFKDDVKEVARGYECGLSFEGYNNLQVGDVVECYEMEEVPA